MAQMHEWRLFLESMQYEHPHLIWWSLPASALTIGLWFLWWRARRKDIETYGDLSLVTKWTRLPSLWTGLALAFSLVVVVVLCFASATMPFRPLGAVNVPAGTLHVVAAFDVSRSMAAENNRADQQVFGGPSCSGVEGPCGRRLDIAKLILINQIMPTIKGNQLGVVIYAGGPIVRSFLNDDFDALTKILTTWKWVDTGVPLGQGAAIGEGSFVADGLLSAVHVLDHGQAKEGQPKPTNVILVFTDGGNDNSDEELAKAYAEVKKADAKVIVVLLGSAEESPIPLYDRDDKPMYEDDGSRSYFKGDDNKIALTARDEDFAKSLADATGGQVLKVTPGQPVSINWPTALAGTKVEIAKRYYYEYPLLAALAILSLIWLAPATSRLHRRRR